MVTRSLGIIAQVFTGLGQRGGWQSGRTVGLIEIEVSIRRTSRGKDFVLRGFGRLAPAAVATVILALGVRGTAGAAWR